MSPAFRAKLFKFGALLGGQDIHDLFPALLTIGHSLTDLVDLLFLRIGQSQLGKHLSHVLAALAVTATVIAIRIGIGRSVGGRSWGTLIGLGALGVGAADRINAAANGNDCDEANGQKKK